MALHHNPKIVTSGLVLALDAANPKSYPGSGTTWYDLSGNGNHGTLNNVTFATSNKGVFITSGDSASYIDVPSPNLASSNYTVFTAARYNGGTRGRMVNGKANNWLIGHWGNSTENYYAEGWVSPVTYGTSDTNWRIFHATGNISGDSYISYVNGVASASGNGGSQGPNGFNIGKIGYSTTEASTGEVAFLYAYNRVLTAVELEQTYNALRTRFI
jgi:hypothetical protein